MVATAILAMLHLVYTKLTVARDSTCKVNINTDINTSLLSQDLSELSLLLESPNPLRKYVDKGGFLRCLLDATDAAAGRAWNPFARTLASARSPWTGTLENKLRKWYWKSSLYDQEEHCYFGSASGIGVALESLGLNKYPKVRGGHNTCYAIEHYDEDECDSEGEVPPEEQYYKEEGKSYRVCIVTAIATPRMRAMSELMTEKATGGYDRFGVNTIGGVIVAKNLESPFVAAESLWKNTPKLHELPEFRHGSDILLAYWLRDNPTPRQLRYYFANNIMNEDTLSLLYSILKSRGH
ncbi:hypothetical protein T440DRAFT_515753 [Plenodomus tracheiphilus IPT5]|uniref:Uncharacterized protein n=1 Tax=Plenodomus tracheiphilus IPT5 TaxID=1408161 RepID=A0A6A7BDR3_9PLEO|nr:hypothetical protein T440DRAFT_515753 [Plenodomus tracheiphilus IPT5]